MRYRQLIIATVMLVSGICGQSVASVLEPSIIGGLNTLQDQSIEQIFDRDGSGTLNIGDVILTVLRLDNNLNSATNYSNGLYAVATQQVSAVTVSPVVAGVSSIYTVSFVPTTAAGFTLSAITGLPAAAAPAGSLAAVYDSMAGFPSDLITSPPVTDVAPLGTLDFSDFIADVTTFGTHQLTLGFDGNAGGVGPNFVSFLSSVLPTVAPAPPIAALTGGGTGFQAGSFSMGLSELVNNMPSVQINRVTSVLDITTGGSSTVDFGVALGSVTGSVGAGYTNPFGAGTFTPSNRDSMQIVFDATIVPEPISLFVWFGILTVALASASTRRR